MNNWRLLLLALVAVFQPIASFTERNLVDGRHQCCDRQSPAPLGDTQPLLHGTYRTGKITSALRRLNDREEIHEDRRYELRPYYSGSSRISAERSLTDTRERATRQHPSVIVRSFNVGHRIENDQSRERLNYVHEREWTARNVRGLKPENENRRVRMIRDALENNRERVNNDVTRNRLVRLSNRAIRSYNDFSEKSYDSQRKLQRVQFRSREFTFTPNREAKDVLKRTINKVTRREATNILNIFGQRIARERLSVVRRETLVRDEPLDVERRSEQRDSLARNTRIVQRIRDMRIREANQEKRLRIGATRRLITDRFDEGRQGITDYRESRILDKENINPELTNERIHQDQRNIRQSRNMIIPHQRDQDSHRQIKYNERSSVIRENQDQKLSRKRLQVDRRGFHEFNRDARDADIRRENRYNKRSSMEKRENPNHRLSRERIHMDRRNMHALRIIDNLATRNERNVEIRREVRYKEKTFGELRKEMRETSDQRLRRERIRTDRRNIRGSRMNSLNQRDGESRRESKHDEKLFRDNRAEIRENFDRRLNRENRQMDRRDIREFRQISSVERNDRDFESWRENSFNERLSRKSHGTYITEQRVESRTINEVIGEERDNLATDRRARSLDRRNFREIRSKSKFSRSVDLARGRDRFRRPVEHHDKIENRERYVIDSRSENVDLSKNRERINPMMVGKIDTENDTTVHNWQYVLYTLQGAYLCALFMHMFTASRGEKAHKMTLRWLPLSSYYNPIKID